MSDIVRVFVAVTFLNDGASAVVQGRDISDMHEKPVKSLAQLKEGSKVLAYWAAEYDFFEAIVRRVSDSKIKLTQAESKKWAEDLLQPSKKSGGKKKESQAQQQLLQQQQRDLFDQYDRQAHQQASQNSHDARRSPFASPPHSRSPSRERGRSRDRQNGHSSSSRQRRSRSPSPCPESRNSKEGIAQEQLEEMKKQLKALGEAFQELKKSKDTGEDGNSEDFVLHKEVPSIKVKRQELKCKLGAKTLQARIKGVYDLLVSREDQTRYCGRGKGTNGRVRVPGNVFGAMCGFFNDKAKTDVTKAIVESINQKGSEARSAAKRKASASSGGNSTSAPAASIASASTQATGGN